MYIHQKYFELKIIKLINLLSSTLKYNKIIQLISMKTINFFKYYSIKVFIK